MPRDDLLFFEIDLARTLEAQQGKLKDTIESFDAKRLLDSPVDDLVKYFADTATVEPLTLDEGAITVEQAEAQYDVTGDHRYMSLPGQRRHMIPATRTSFFVPFTGDRELFRCRPSS